MEKVIDNSKDPITLYPNPFKDEIQFLQENEDDFNIKLYSIEGERIISKEIMSKQPLNLDFLKSGLYLYKIQTDKGEIQRGKLIKN